MSEPGTIPVIVRDANTLPPIGTEVVIRFTDPTQSQPYVDAYDSDQLEFSYNVLNENGAQIGSTELLGVVSDRPRRAEVVAVDEWLEGLYKVRIRLLDD